MSSFISVAIVNVYPSGHTATPMSVGVSLLGRMSDVHSSVLSGDDLGTLQHSHRSLSDLATQFGLSMCGGFSNMVLEIALLKLSGSALGDAAASGRGGGLAAAPAPPGAVRG